MAILQAGYPKSGNYWLYKILLNIQNALGKEKKSFIQSRPIYSVAKHWDLAMDERPGKDVLFIQPEGVFWGIDKIFRYPVENIDEYIDKCSLVWTHSDLSDAVFSVFERFSKIIYIIRDPRSVIVSWSRYAFTPYMMKFYPHHYRHPGEFNEAKYRQLTKKWVKNISGYLQFRNELSIHIVFYERLLHEFDNEFQGILSYLGVDLDDETTQQIKNQVSFKSMRLENRYHVRNGSSTEWIDSLSDIQKVKIVEIAGPLLKILGYPVEIYDITEVNKLPSLPASFKFDQLVSGFETTERAKYNSIYKHYKRKLWLLYKYWRSISTL